MTVAHIISVLPQRILVCWLISISVTFFFLGERHHNHPDLLVLSTMSVIGLGLILESWCIGGCFLR